MLSVIVYGRNDDYGYNLHKRAALSLNNIASLFENEDDEIVFVDYNTPNAMPTFPESIADTLTSKAKKHLVVVRVRPKLHEKYFAGKTHLATLEPVARNVGLRQSNQDNTWVLNTNTDILLVPRFCVGLGAILQSTRAHFFIAPRFELPESVWEGFDRARPEFVSDQLRSIKRSLFLAENVYGDEWNLYDAPGDFQLIRRTALHSINGFDERMTLGWHCDSNLNKRLFLKYGKPSDGGQLFDCFHCDHTRKFTPMHKKNAPANNSDKFIHDVQEAKVNLNNEWGLRRHDLEVFRFSEKSQLHFTTVVEKTLAKEPYVETFSYYTGDCFEKNTVPDLHVVPFLGNEIANFSLDAEIGWIGAKGKLFDKFQILTQDLGFVGRVAVPNSDTKKVNYDILVVCFAAPFFEYICVNKTIFRNLKLFCRLRAKSEKILKNKDTKFIFIGAAQTRYENWIIKHFSVSRTPFSTRVMSGYFTTDLEHFLKRFWFKSQASGFVDLLIWGRFRNWLLLNRSKHRLLYLVARVIYRFVKSIKIFVRFKDK